MKIVRDFSHWNVIDYYEKVRDSADAFIIKAYDIEFNNAECEDPAHDDHYFNLRPKPVAEYLYFDPSANARTQVQGYMNVSYRGFLDALDVEETEGIDHNTVTSRVIACGENFILEAGRKAWLYSNLNFLDNILLEPSRILTLFAGIWLAWPVSNATAPRLPKHYPPEFTKLWQRSWTTYIPGVNGPTDESVWLGTDAEFDQLVMMPPIPPPPPDVLEPRVAALEEQMSDVLHWAENLALE